MRKRGEVNPPPLYFHWNHCNLFMLFMLFLSFFVCLLACLRIKSVSGCETCKSYKNGLSVKPTGSSGNIGVGGVKYCVSSSMSGGDNNTPTQNVSLSNENYLWLAHQAETRKTSFSGVVNEYISEARELRGVRRRSGNKVRRMSAAAGKSKKDKRGKETQPKTDESGAPEK